jgi:uncharacterized protein (TIGR03083 family)
VTEDRRDRLTQVIPEVSCETCVALCCRAPVNMIMTKEEHKRYGRTMDLQVLVEPRAFRRRVGPQDASNIAGSAALEIPAGHGLFELVSGCANLTPSNRCGIYATRPSCCRDFAVGSPECLKLRRDAGLDGDIAATDDDPLRDGIMADYFREGRAVTPERLDLVEVRAAVMTETAWIVEQLRSMELRAWSRRTRCAGWDVSAVAGHLVGVLQFASAALLAIDEGTTAHAPDEFRAKGAAVIEPFERAALAVSDLLDVIDPSAVDHEVTIDEMTVGVDHLVQVLVMELSVHACDLADALRLERQLTPQAIRAIANVLPDLLDSGAAPNDSLSYVLLSDSFAMPFNFRGGAWVNEAGPNSCRIEGDAEGVLLFALGRKPFDAETLTTNRVATARAFKRHLTGP